MVAKLCLKYPSVKIFVNFDTVKDMSKILLHFSSCLLVLLCSSIHDRKPPPLRLSTSFSGFHCCRGFYIHDKWPTEFSGHKQDEFLVLLYGLQCIYQTYVYVALQSSQTRIEFRFMYKSNKPSPYQTS